MTPKSANPRKRGPKPRGVYVRVLVGMTEEERATVKRAAGTVKLGPFIRRTVLDAIKTTNAAERGTEIDHD